ncbi:MAG: hypothetical protein DMG72_10330 [Acidobacteria bacterium]|nr:MAG: hypothetical protein DMG72_10330 [Acidobacteriota bacterium]
MPRRRGTLGTRSEKVSETTFDVGRLERVSEQGGRSANLGWRRREPGAIAMRCKRDTRSHRRSLALEITSNGWPQSLASRALVADCGRFSGNPEVYDPNTFSQQYLPKRKSDAE